MQILKELLNGRTYGDKEKYLCSYIAKNRRERNFYPGGLCRISGMTKTEVFDTLSRLIDANVMRFYKGKYQLLRSFRY